MAEITFIYNGNSMAIQCQKDESIGDAFNKSSLKSGLELSNYYFLYSGNTIESNLTFNQLAQEEDKIKNKMKILVYSSDKNNENKSTENSKDIICPKCGENCLIDIQDYKIFFYNCKNEHKVSDIPLDKFEKTQEVDLTKVKCNNCSNDKSISFRKEFFKCLTCNKNICPLCKNSHTEEHDIIKYDKKPYICNIHNMIYSSFCKKCNDNLCMFCESEHKDKENIIYYRDNLPNIDLMNNQINELKLRVDKFKEKINEIKKILNKTLEKIEIYSIINENIIKNYKKKNINYQILKNINTIINYNTIVLNDINFIKNDNNLINIFNNSLKIFNGINNKFISDINSNNNYKSITDRKNDFNKEKIKSDNKVIITQKNEDNNFTNNSNLENTEKKKRKNRKKNRKKK